MFGLAGVFAVLGCGCLHNACLCGLHDFSPFWCYHFKQAYISWWFFLSYLFSLRLMSYHCQLLWSHQFFPKPLRTGVLVFFSGTGQHIQFKVAWKWSHTFTLSCISTSSTRNHVTHPHQKKVTEQLSLCLGLHWTNIPVRWCNDDPQDVKATFKLINQNECTLIVKTTSGKQSCDTLIRNSFTNNSPIPFHCSKPRPF